MTRLARCSLILAFAGLLAACEDGRIGVELSADPPAAVTTQEVDVSLDGITLQRDDGSEDRIDFDNTVRVNLMRFDNVTFPLLDAEALDAGDYTGIRLEFHDSSSDDSDNYVIDTSHGRRPLTINASNEFTPLNLTVKKKGKTYTVQVRLDLRLSLTADSSSPSLTPVLRAARDTKAARVSGSVKDSLISTSSCRDGRSTGVGVAIYAFKKLGDSVAPDDYDGSEPDPVASTPVHSSGSSSWQYNIGVLPPGDYTLALTCDGDQENPSTSQDEIGFLNDTHDVSLDEGDEQDQDFN
ncbi:MAG: hypothetical protein JWQ90_2060 [Hydrocarboniphaga sp.]|uniref:DUF4382 domain-containing protein n=1 Tax=Hydrocarboniphaga sp. TaxID=2033016 RepID=UPI002606E784|nr:DUF4382 domain-containing protein [Hydrocarboniphaga sp.]MDB5969610.1 hypothetical protein [Hydrocarboniphaga sp.]